MGIVTAARYISGGVEPVYATADRMVGCTVTKARRSDPGVFTEESFLAFETDRGVFVFGHLIDCCEEVLLEEVNIDLSTVCGLVTRAEEATSREPMPEDAWGDSCTWTFYRFSIGGQDFEARWFGQSNGYYSESVDVMFSPKGGSR